MIDPDEDPFEELFARSREQYGFDVATLFARLRALDPAQRVWLLGSVEKER